MCRGAKLMVVLGGACTVAACAVAPPSGPTVMALPSQGKGLTAFQQEDRQCRNYAAATIGDLQPGQAATQKTIGSAAVGTAAAGAGAAIGGATDLVGDTAAGTNHAADGEYDLQARYNIAYTQCMYSRGDTVQYLPSGGYTYYDSAIAGYPWYDWSGPGFFGGGVVVFDRDHEFHRGFHDRFHRGSHEASRGGFHEGLHGGLHGGFHGGRGFHG
jgi:hypothetical protein